MADHRALSGSLAFYAAGTLDESERLQLEEHLAGCDDCRGHLRQIRRFADLGAETPMADALEHVAPGLLVAYADDRGSLDEETVSFVEERLAACSICRDALANLREVDAALAAEPQSTAASAQDDRSASAWAGWWDFLSSTFLRPAPALAYLLIAAVGLPLLWTLRGPGDPVSAVRVIGLSGERTLRDGGARAEPIDIPVNASRSPVLLELLTELNTEDLRSGTLAFTVELTAGGRSVWSRSEGPSAFILRDDRGVLPLVLDPGALHLERAYRLVIRVDRPGDPLHGQALFTRHVRFTEK